MALEHQHLSKTKLLDAALNVIRSKGYAASSIEDICQQAGVTKGSFFHHFNGKDELAVEAVAHWDRQTGQFFAAADYRQANDPMDRILGYVDFRAAILTGNLPDYTCLLGTLVQETYTTHPKIRAACNNGLSLHITELVRDIEAAKLLHAPNAKWNAESVGNLIQVVLQGSFVLAKSKQGPEVIRESLAHLRSYLEILFNQSGNSR